MDQRSNVVVSTILILVASIASRSSARIPAINPGHLPMSLSIGSDATGEPPSVTIASAGQYGPRTAVRKDADFYSTEMSNESSEEQEILKTVIEAIVQHQDSRASSDQKVLSHSTKASRSGRIAGDSRFSAERQGFQGLPGLDEYQLTEDDPYQGSSDVIAVSLPESVVETIEAIREVEQANTLANQQSIAELEDNAREEGQDQINPPLSSGSDALESPSEAELTDLNEIELRVAIPNAEEPRNNELSPSSALEDAEVGNDDIEDVQYAPETPATVEFLEEPAVSSDVEESSESAEAEKVKRLIVPEWLVRLSNKHLSNGVPSAQKRGHSSPAGLPLGYVIPSSDLKSPYLEEIDDRQDRFQNNSEEQDRDRSASMEREFSGEQEGLTGSFEQEHTGDAQIVTPAGLYQEQLYQSLDATALTGIHESHKRNLNSTTEPAEVGAAANEDAEAKPALRVGSGLAWNTLVDRSGSGSFDFASNANNGAENSESNESLKTPQRSHSSEQNLHAIRQEKTSAPADASTVPATLPPRPAGNTETHILPEIRRHAAAALISENKETTFAISPNMALGVGAAVVALIALMVAAAVGNLWYTRKSHQRMIAEFSDCFDNERNSWDSHDKVYRGTTTFVPDPDNEFNASVFESEVSMDARARQHAPVTKLWPVKDRTVAKYNFSNLENIDEES